MTTPDNPPPHAAAGRRSGIDRRAAPRVPLTLEGTILLDGGVALPCTVHDVSESGIGITIDPVAAKAQGTRLRVRCGDRIRLGFRMPGQGQLMRASVRVCRIWCRNGVVEMGLAVSRVNPRVLEALELAGGIDRRARPGRDRAIARRDLERLLLRVSDDVFPRIAKSFEDAANADEGTCAGAFFRALVQIEAGRPDIARRFVGFALSKLLLDSGSDPDTAAGEADVVSWRFDHEVLADAFCRACELRESDTAVQQVVEELVVAAGFRHLAPALPTDSL